MKIGLCLALVVLLASTNVFGDDKLQSSFLDQPTTQTTKLLTDEPFKNLAPALDGESRDEKPRELSNFNDEERRPSSSFQGRNPRPTSTFQDDKVRPASTLQDEKLRPNSNFQDDKVRPVSTLQDEKLRPNSNFNGEERRPASTFQDEKLRPASTFQDDKVRPASTLQDEKLRPNSNFNGEERRPASTFQDDKSRPTSNFNDEKLRPASTFQDDKSRPVSNFNDEKLRPTSTFQDDKVRPASTFQDEKLRPASSFNDEERRPTSNVQDEKLRPTSSLQGGKPRPISSFRDEERRPSSSFRDDESRPTSRFPEDELKPNSRFEGNEERPRTSVPKGSSRLGDSSRSRLNSFEQETSLEEKQSSEKIASESRTSTSKHTNQFLNEDDKEFGKNPDTNGRLAFSEDQNTFSKNKLELEKSGKSSVNKVKILDVTEETDSHGNFNDNNGGRFRLPAEKIPESQETFGRKKPVSRPESFRENALVDQTLPSNVVLPSTKPATEYPIILENRVRITGSISIAQTRPSLIGSVQYDFKGGRVNSDSLGSTKARLPNELNFIAEGSRVMLYVSTLNTFDRRQAFTNFSIPLNGNSFPLEFRVDISLPSSQLRLLRNSDLTLYFFAYVTSPTSRLETFIPEGSCQILLQGTNRVVQHVEVFVKTNGIELKGVFNGLYGEKFILPGTTFQVLIISEEFVHRLIGNKVDYAAQILINNVPSMYPFVFDGLVPYQKLKEGTRYFVISYIIVNGVERLLTSKPILVINENRVVVTTELTINVPPFPFILSGTVTRAMPGSFHFEYNSSIIFSMFEIDSDLPPITFRLGNINRLPQEIQVNISQVARFDYSKKYEVTATLLDSRNSIYMTSSRRIPLLTTSPRLLVPVEDIYYHVQVSLHSSVNQALNFIPESKAMLIVTDNPESTTTPLFDAMFDPIYAKSNGYLMKIPISSVQRVRNSYLILMVNNSGIITHVSKVLLMSNGQPPSLRIDLPVIQLSLIRGQIIDAQNRVAQWSPAAYANVYLLDDRIEDPFKAIVQTWKIYLEREFPVNFEVHLDFARLIPGRTYSLQSSIETNPGFFEYKPASTLRVIEPERRIQDNIRIAVKNVMTYQSIRGIIYLDEIVDMISDKDEVVIQLSSTAVLEKPAVVYETRFAPDRSRLAVNFTMDVLLDRIDINSIYYFMISYVSGPKVIIPPKQAYAFSPRNQMTVILRLSKSEQVRVSGEVTSTGGLLMLPLGASLHLQITEDAYNEKPLVHSEVTIQANPRNMYKFTMYLNSALLRRNVTFFLHASIVYKGAVILSIPKPAPIQMSIGSEWNVQLRIDLPTLVIGYIDLIGEKVPLNGEYDAFVEFYVSGTERIVSTTRLRMAGAWPRLFRIEIANELIAKHSQLEARALIKNCKEEILFRSAGSASISARLNVGIELPIALVDPKRMKDLSVGVDVEAPINGGVWSISMAGTSALAVKEPFATLENERDPLF